MRGCRENAAERLGFASQSIISGAGHDAVYLSRVAPTAMIFVPCKDGISHNEIEDAERGTLRRVRRSVVGNRRAGERALNQLDLDEAKLVGVRVDDIVRDAGTARVRSADSRRTSLARSVPQSQVPFVNGTTT